ncbi:GTP-binding protein [Rhizobium sp. RU36D]|uniref:CobW family GTP-binding protein n=1 Tax=Rhizobium sp. RU36D TaxID=1907415 RepID=UPI000A063ACC|nr:GTP-binding protein [Rhizobium sp. RU36D]
MFQGRDRVAVSVLTGFLGAGKSTLLNRILKDSAMKDAAVIINEFGEVGIDHLLVESSGDGLIELSDGCLCCTVRGELVDTLASLMDGMQTGRIKPLSRIVIETTGLADPAPVLQSVIGNPVIASNFEIEGVVTVVDAVNGLSTLDRFEEAVKQVAVADRLVLSKAALVADEEGLVALKGRLAQLNPRAPLMDGDADETGRASIFENGLYDPATKIADVDRWLKDEATSDHHHHHHHDHHDVNRHGESIRSHSIIHDRPIDPAAIEMFVDLLRSAHGERLLRMKAIVALADNPDRPLVLHGVQSVFHPPVRLPAWPDPADRRTRLVLITQDMPESYVEDLFAAFIGAPRIDRPDREALENNPLAVSGMTFR